MTQNKDRRFRFVSFCLGIVLILALIHIGGILRGNRVVFPKLSEIGDALFRLLSRETTYAMIGTTMIHLLESLAVSMFVGVIAGIAEGLSDRIRNFLAPFMILIRSLPMIVLVILIMTTFSYTFVPVMAASLILIPMISEAASEGCRRIEPEMIDVFRMNSGLNIRVMTYVYLPMISGYLKQSFFNAAGMGLKVVVSAEYLVQTRNSLGKAVYSSSYFNEYGEIYAYALIMILLVLIVTEIPAMFLRKLKNTTNS